MKFAFSTVACPQWDFQTIAANARQLGYDGVEIRLQNTLPDPAQIRSTFAAAQVEIAVLASSVALAGKRKADNQAAVDLNRYIDTAQAIGCPVVRIFGTCVHAGRSLVESAALLGQWLLPLVEYAADHQVTLAIENAFPFRRASEIWAVLEAVNHPALAVCWDLLAAIQAGEPPAISVPVLNTRIQCVRVTDATIEQNTVRYCKLGEGTLPVRKLLSRLQGIGYRGWVSLDWPKASIAQLAEPDEVLPDAIGKLRDWTKPPAKPEKEKPAARKPAPPAAPAPATAAAG
jgi:sugar phosphate isomerase/epimerase